MSGNMRTIVTAAALAAGAAACGPSREPKMPLARAVAGERLDEMNALLRQGADVNQRDAGGARLTPLAIAACRGDLAVIEALVRSGADPNLRAGINDWTPMMHAIHKHKNEAVKALLERAPDLELKEGFGGSYARFFARMKGCKEVLALIDARKPAKPASAEAR